jgi:hypothetical protein
LLSSMVWIDGGYRRVRDRSLAPFEWCD